MCGDTANYLLQACFVLCHVVHGLTCLSLRVKFQIQNFVCYTLMSQIQSLLKIDSGGEKL